MSERRSWDEMKLARDGHMVPRSVCSQPKPNGPPPRAWRIVRGDDGLPSSMGWMGPRCRDKSPSGWECVRLEGHEDMHAARSGPWVTTWRDGDAAETHRDATATPPDSESENQPTS